MSTGPHPSAAPAGAAVGRAAAAARRELLAAVRDVRAAARSATRRGLLWDGLLVVVVGAVTAVQSLRPQLDVLVSVPAGLTLVAATAALLLLRHVRPATSLAGLLLLLVAPAFATFLVLPVAALTAGRRVRDRRAWAAVAAAGSGSLLLGVVTDDELATWELVAGWCAVVLLVVVVPAAFGVVLGDRRPAGRLLRERTAQLEGSRELTAARARVQERARIATEMHDMLGHRLSLLSMHAGALELRAARDHPAVSEQARLLRGTAATALAELRQILELTSSGAAAAEPGSESGDRAAGTRDAVAELVRQSRETGLDATLEWTGDDLAGADPRTRQAVHRVVREGLTNVHVHAPTAGAVAVRVEVRPPGAATRVRATVSNPAPAVPPQPPGARRGLAGLEERAELVGGTCTGGPTAGGGFELRLDVPAVPATAPPPLPAGSGADPEEVMGLVVDDTVHDLPPLRDADLMSTRRLLVLVALAALLALPVLAVLLFLAFPEV